jgi:hypothetical protein
MRIPGRISTTKTARILSVHRNTVIAWAQRAVEGKASPLKDVIRFPPRDGYYWVSLEEVHALRDKWAGCPADKSCT